MKNNMMLSLAIIIVLCMLYVDKATLVQQERVFYVLSEDQLLSTHCPEEENCYRLTELINNNLNLPSGQVSNTTIIALLPGTHTCTSAVNKTLSISNVTNFALRAANSSAGATIKCNGSIGFSFSFITNVTITGVVFKECGSYQTCDYKGRPRSIAFTLLLNYSMNANISNVTITDGNGIGMILMNPQGQTTITHFYISHSSHGNIYVFSTDSKHIALSDTTIVISNSNFTDSANDIRIDHNSCIPIGEHPFGVQFVLVHSRYHIHVKLINISAIQNDINIYLQYTSLKSTIKIKGLKSVGKMGVSRFISVASRKLSSSKLLENFTIMIENSYIIGEISFLKKGKASESTMNYVLLSNVCFESSQKRIFINSQNITLRNVTVLGTLNGITHDNCIINIEGTLSFLRNQGGFIIQKQTNVTVHKNSNFIFRHNINDSESPFVSTDSNIRFLANSLILFENNTGSQSGGITFINTIVIFKGGSNLVFTSNRGKRGGAMAFYAQSHVLFTSGVTNLTFTNNYGSIVGGAIYVQDSNYPLRVGHHRYLTRFFFNNPNTTKKPTFYFSNNTAIQAGDALYGGGGNAEDIKFNNTASTDWSIAATTPFRICSCESSKPKCYRYNRRTIAHINLLPGQTFNIEVVAVGYWDGTVPANIYAEYRLGMDSKEKLPKPQQIQSVGRQCTNLSYTIFFANNEEVLKLQIITHERNSKPRSMYIFLKRRNCTLELVYNNLTKSCECSPILVKAGIECDLQTLKIKRRSPFWVNATFAHLLPQHWSGVIVHNHCPFDYCTTTDIVAQPLDLLYPDEQCAFNRFGTLCGACQSNFSHILGTSKCKQCTTPWIALIIPLIAIAGVILVLGLMLLNLTVSTGTINGLIFYANILRANHAVYFPHQASNSFLSIFIAWLNLDLGIEICVYDGLDAYSKTWLQFFFPLYIWIIVTAIIVVSHYSTRVSRLFGNNAIQVLATLFLLSYAKLLRIIITVFSSTQLVYPDGYIRWVWLYDGNVNYLQGKHTGLFVAALLLLVLVSIPYTVSLLCIQWLQKISHYKLLFWVMKLQPLFDAYTGPYKIKHRYWTGLLLLVRVFLYLMFSINTLGDPAINLLSTVVVVMCLLAYTSLVGGVYKILWIHFLETAFLLNSVILPAVTLYRINSAAAVTRITYTSTGIAFMLFIAIIVYHLAKKITQINKVQPLLNTAKENFSFKLPSKENKQCSTETTELSSKVTFSVIDLDPNEPLLCD
jgi:hypothetical protein